MMADLDFPLVPSEQGLTADQDLDAAVSSALAGPSAQSVTQAAPRPYGRSWAFDFVNRAMVRRGGSPALVQGTDALVQWCLMAVYTARYASPVFSDSFGIERPYQMIGLADPTPLLLDFERRLRSALLVHDRITAIEDYEASYDPSQGVFECSFTVRTDEEEQVPVGGLRLLPVD